MTHSKPLKRSPRSSRHQIAVLAFDRISPFHLSVPCVVFGESQPVASPFDLRVCAIEPGLLRTTAGFSVMPEHGLEGLKRANTVIVPSWRDPAEQAPPALLAALRAAHKRGARLVGLCLGAYVLAQAGLLTGRRATTHWAYAQDFSARFPDVEVAPDVLYVDDGDVLTSAGTAAGIDACLHLLRGQCGHAVANGVARRLVVPPHRQGGQAQFIEQAMPATARGSRLAGVLDLLRADLLHPWDVDEVAERAVMSRRTCTRQFRQLTGGTLGEWLLRERLALAQRLLESGDGGIEQVAASAGFGSAGLLRQHFKAAFGVTPSAWRQMFRAG
ncbi:GlxA family transcriptional regulator [Roseateles koreensis]|uniref:Helix-turn-helix domain-containing protein n=1 Tax=Roseateles koreensis TaxID=2987526 RepID=A0ABT5KLY9_9BURK|nr:helix-turn-helix domain-containing protein [Roseateles koreensis]MDC8783932.1 helix-turn-helix domain-containing protein [Roseateles koreensis]